jgi:hypothetical protein
MIMIIIGKPAMIPHFNVKSFSFYSIDASRTEEKAQQKN